MRRYEVPSYEHFQLPVELQVRVSTLPKAIQAAINVGLLKTLDYFGSMNPPFTADDITSITFNTIAAYTNIPNVFVSVRVTRRETTILNEADFAKIEANLSQIQGVVIINFPIDENNPDRHTDGTTHMPLNRELFAAVKELVVDMNSNDGSPVGDDIPATTIERNDPPKSSGWRGLIESIFGCN